MSIETFHKASLVHDDIEDNDDYRYGDQTLHRKFGTPTAIGPVMGYIKQYHGWNTLFYFVAIIYVLTAVFWALVNCTKKLVVEAAATDSVEIVDEDEAAEIAVEEPQDEVLLTEVASDSELFDDPNLDVASVAPGEEREIVVPVEMGRDGETKRFKLSVRLRLDPVD